MSDAASTLSERFSLDDIISGLASDLADLRAGRISLRDARARAEIAREIFKGVRLAVDGQRIMAGNAKQIGQRDRAP